MHTADTRPELRPVESIVVPDAKHGRVLVLRDTQGVTDSNAVIPPHLVPIVARFSGQMSCAEIARQAGAELGTTVPVHVVVRLANELDEACFLTGARFQQARARVERDFALAKVRPASHAGGAYHADAAKLRSYLDTDCLGAARRANGRANGTATGVASTPKPSGAPPSTRNGSPPKRMVGLVAPHIDPWRGAIGYGHAYNALARALPDEADTFVLLGTSHAPMREPFALCRKAFATPLGALEPDVEAIDRVAEACSFDAYADQFNHKREHSLEFQAVFLKHVLGDRKARIVPVLAGIGRHQARGTDPSDDRDVRSFLEALQGLVASRPGRTMLVAGADFAHVGPRFGDEKAYGDRERETLERTDRASLACAEARDARAFWSDVARDLDSRRVCGLAPIYTLLEALPGGVQGETLHYEQTVDDEDGSIVSHAAVAFYAA